jgi:hypothetical protein
VVDTATSSRDVRGASVRTTVITARDSTDTVSETIVRMADATLATATIRDCLENKSRLRYLCVHMRSYRENRIVELDG